MSPSDVHFLVLIHGMWGHPNDLAEMARIIEEEKKESLGDAFEVLVSQTNKDDWTYDGIDWGAERVADEILETIKKVEDGDRKVTKFSVTGYSLGGLVARYAIGILHRRRFFDTVQPVNFNTFATPHIGLPRYSTFFSSLSHKLGSSLLSRTGVQFYLKDSWSNTGQPLIEVMADPIYADLERVFYQALALFLHIRIYANAVYDVTVPYVTSAIEAHDPFTEAHADRMTIETDDKYPNLIKSHVSVVTPTPANAPKPSRQLQLPFGLSKFPANIVVYPLAILVIPIVIPVALVRVSLSSHSSRARIKILEKDPLYPTRLSSVLAQLGKEMDIAVSDLMDREATGGSTSSPNAVVPIIHEPTSNHSQSQSASGDPEPQASQVHTTSLTTPATSEPPQVMPPASSAQPIITPLQHQIIKSLNALPQLRKELLYFPNVMNSHSVIVCRDPKRFSFHTAGEGGLRHWAYHFAD